MHKIFSFKDNGGKVISIQHGSSYRDLNYIRHLIELKMDHFISWGGKNILIIIKIYLLPSPQLKRPKLNLKKFDICLFQKPMGFAPKYYCMSSNRYFKQTKPNN